MSFFIFLFLLTIQVNAQDPAEFEGLRFVCLNQTRCRAEGDCSTINLHRTKLTTRAEVKGIANDPNTYVTECLEIDQGGVPKTVCTTGNATLDKELFCGDPNSSDPQCDHLQILKDTSEYSITEGITDENYGVYHKESGQLVKKDPPTKIATNAIGDIASGEIEWQSYTPHENLRKFLIWNKTEHREDLQDPSKSGLGGQQQADLNFLFRSSSCVGEQWDPYGKVFDITTLEPLSGANVTLKQYNSATKLYEEAFANVNNPNITNPYLTGIFGKFNFIVQDGSYTLTPALGGYIHPTSQEGAGLTPDLRNRMNKIYTNIYYSNSDPIRQQGAIQQRDVPMQLAAGGTPVKSPLKILTELEQVQSNGQIIYSGKVSHPFAELKIEVCDTAGVCGAPKVYTAQEGGPDKDGKFKVTLDQKELVQGQTFKKTFTPVDLATAPLVQIPSWLSKTISFLGTFIGSVEAQEQSRSVSSTSQPIPTYIEGYAYDTDGNLLPNAVVGIYVSFSNNPVYQTRTNEQGYFKITSDKLPTTGYSIGYATAPNEKAKSKVTTSQFLQQNKEFTAAEKVNPYMFATASTDPRRNVTPAFVPQSKIAAVSNEFKDTEPTVTTSPAEPATVQAGANNLLLIGAILLLLVATVGTLLGVYLYKKKMQDAEPQI